MMRVRRALTGRRCPRPVIVLATLLALAPGTAHPSARAAPGQIGGLTMLAALTDNVVWVDGSAGAPVDVELRDAAGLRARTTAETVAGQTRLRARLADTAGQPVYPRASDTLTARQGGATSTFVLPPLTVRVQRDADRVDGSTAAGLPVEVTVRDGTGPHVATSIADDAGAWSATFKPAVNLRGGHRVTVTVGAVGQHQLQLNRLVATVTVSLMPGEISGFGAPFGTISAELVDRATARELGRGQAVASHVGGFRLWARDARGRIVRPDTSMDLFWRDGSDDLRIPVGRLSAFWDLGGNRLLGMGEPYAHLDVTVSSPWYPRDYDNLAAEVTYRGFWQATPAVTLRPGHRFTVREQVGEGDALVYDQSVPLVGVQPGSAVVTVDTLTGASADLALRRAADTVATATGGGPWSGDLALVLRDAGGQAVPARPGDILHARLDGWELDVHVTPLIATLDRGGYVVGTAPPGQLLRLGDGGPVAGPVMADAQGRFEVDAGDRAIATDPSPGASFAAYYVSAEGHHIQHRFQGPALEVPVTGSDFSGRVMPEADFAVRRQVAGHTAWSSYDARSDELGHFWGAITPSRQPAPPKGPGDVYALATGRITTTITLPVLTATLDAASGVLTGTGPPNDVVEASIALGPDGDRPEVLDADTDAQGEYRLNLRAPGSGRPSVDPANVREITIRWWHGGNAATRTIAGPRPGWFARVLLPRVDVP